MISLTPTTAPKCHKRLMPLFLLSALFLPVTGVEAAANQKPSVKIIKIPAANEQTQVTLTGICADKDGVIAGYEWAQTTGPSVSLTSNTAPQTSFTTPTVTKPTRLGFTLKATDGLKSATAKTTILVKPVNTPPKADAGLDKSAVLGATVVLNGANSNDSDGQIKVWYWQQISGPKVKLTRSKTSSASFIAPAKLSGTRTSTPLKFRLSVTDNEKRKTSDEIIVTLQKTPSISLALENQNFTNNEALSPNTSKTLTWTIKNTSNIDLNNVAVNPDNATGFLTIGPISPATIETWASGETKTFSALVGASAFIATGTHTQNWTLSYDNGKPLSFSNTDSAIGFSLTTQSNQIPPGNLSLTLENKNFVDNEVIVREANGTINRSLTWTIKNTSDIDLSNIKTIPGAKTGSLTINTIDPSNISTWLQGESKTFSTSVTASSTIGAGAHSQSWNLTDQYGNILPFAAGQSLGFTLQTDAVGQCTSNTAQSAPVALAATLPYTKISAGGAKLSANISQWSCVQANNTNLMWELKTDDSGLHDKDWTYSWYQPNSGQTGNNLGVPNGGDCGNNNPNCDTESFVQAVNNQGLCGYHDWRMPTDQELLGLLSTTDTEPAINGNFFPLTQQSMYWSSTSTEDGLYAWYVSFGKGYHSQNLKGSPRYVRLVRNVK